jgi:alpha-glucoside transport system substrate-binding protein
MSVRTLLSSLSVVALSASLAACGGSSSSSSTTTQPPATTTNQAALTGKVSIVGVWTGDEQKSFQAVLKGFKKKYPNVTVSYKSTGDNTPTVLSTAVAGGNPPDLAAVSQPGLVADFQKKGALKTLDFAKGTLAANYPASVVDLGKIDGHIYGLLIKAANKSTVWYNVASFESAGVKPPTTWDEFVSAINTVKASGQTPLSIGGADGWTLTDLFENIYLRQAGPETYKALSTHGYRAEVGVHGRRDVRGVADRLPHLGLERVLDQPQGVDGDRRRLRPGCGLLDEQAEARLGLQRLRVPGDR